MSASTMAPLAASPAVRSSGWIISRRQDLGWFIGSAAAGYGALALMAAGVPLLLVQLVWLLGIDGPHVFATVTRTYFDRQERARYHWMVWGLVPLVLVGPLMVWAGQAGLFFLLAVCWQHYHISKQHVGFVMLWRAKHRDRNRREAQIDRWFVILSTGIPLGFFVAMTYLEAYPIAASLAWAAAAGHAVIVAAYGFRQYRQWRAGDAVNGPKLLLLAVLIPLQWLAFGYAAQFGADGIVRAGIALGLFHSFQYHRLLWFHNQNRYGSPGARDRHGVAAVLARDFGRYILVAGGLHLLISAIPQYAFPQTPVIAAAWGFAFMHYVLDSKIWRVRGDRELALALRI